MVENGSIVVLSDEEGNELECEYLKTVTYDETDYAVMYPIDQDEEDGEVIILEVIPPIGSEKYASVSDENILDAVFAEFKQSWDN